MIGKDVSNKISHIKKSLSVQCFQQAMSQPVKNEVVGQSKSMLLVFSL